MSFPRLSLVALILCSIAGVSSAATAEAKAAMDGTIFVEDDLRAVNRILAASAAAKGKGSDHDDEVIDLDDSSSSSSSSSSAHSTSFQSDQKENLDESPDDAIQFKHFVAHNKTMTCSADEHALPFNNQIRGTNLGGWMVLEPWITPSLFYQFLGADENSTAFDMYTFCEVLGPKEGNKQLRRHWKTWVTEAHIETMYHSGAVNSLRLPVGDFMYKPYGPYGKRMCIQLISSRVILLLTFLLLLFVQLLFYNLNYCSWMCRWSTGICGTIVGLVLCPRY